MSGLTLEKLDPQFEAEPTGLTLEKFGISPTEPVESYMPEAEEQRPNEDMGLFVKGWHRGKEQLQATGYGALGLAGSGLGIEALKDYGYEGYLRNIKEAEKYSKEQEFLKIRSPADAGKWALETFGEVAPSMIEAGVTATAGALAASAMAPGPGTVTGGIAGFFGKRAVKNMLDLTAKQYIKKGLAPGIAKKAAQELVEKIGKSAIQKQALKSIGSKVGVVLATLPIEAGGNWGEAMEKGIDNPWSALATGTAAAMLELAGGNIRIIDKVLGPKTGKVFAEAVKHKKPGIVSRIVREAAHQAPQEFFQESGQELLSIANIAYNDPTFERYTRENLERVIEAGAAGGVVGLTGGLSGIITPKTIQNTAEATLTDDQTYLENRDQFVEQLNKGFADGTVSIEDVIEAKTQHEEGENPDPKVISAFNSIISKYEETAGPVEGAEAQKALAALENFREAIDGLDTQTALKTKDKFIKQYPWLEDQANEAIADAQVYAGARKRVGLLTPVEKAERDYETYQPPAPRQIVKEGEGVAPEPTSIFELQERVKKRQAEAAAKEKELALKHTALPPGQGFRILTKEEAQVRQGLPYSPELAGELRGPKVLPPGQGFERLPSKPETRLRKAPPTYPEGAKYVVGKAAPEGLDVEHKPILTTNGVPYKNEKQAKNALKYQKRFKNMGINPKTYRVIPVKDGFAIIKKIKETKSTKETKLKEISEKVKAQTPTMLKESDRVNDVTLGTLVDVAAKNPDKALEHAADATVSKAKLIEGLKNKGLKAMGEAKTREERVEIKKNLEETLRGIEGAKSEVEPTLDTLNPTGTLFTDYTPQDRAAMKLGKDITTLDKTSGKPSDETITIYRGAPKNQKEIVPGDYITTNRKLAEDYAGGGNILEKNVRMSDVLDDKIEPLGEEYIYKPGKIVKPGKVKKPAAEVPAKQPWEMTREEYLRPVKAAAYRNKRTGKIIEGAPEELHAEIAKRLNLSIESINANYECGFVNPNGKFLTRSEGGKLLGRVARDAQLIIHRGIVHQALKSGKLTPEKYAELHEKDYGPLEKFMPEVVEKPKAEKETKDPISAILSSKKKIGIKYEMEIRVAETGETATVTKDAGVALRETKEELDKYNNFLECLI